MTSMMLEDRIFDFSGCAHVLDGDSHQKNTHTRRREGEKRERERESVCVCIAKNKPRNRALEISEGEINIMYTRKTNAQGKGHYIMFNFGISDQKIYISRHISRGEGGS